MPSDMKERIAREFAELARTKSIDKITVKDIVEACHITRQTFYYHFQDLIDVIDWSLRQAMEELVEKSIRIDSREQVIELFLSEAVKGKRIAQKASGVPAEGTDGAPDCGIGTFLFSGDGGAQRAPAGCEPLRRTGGA